MSLTILSQKEIRGYLLIPWNIQQFWVKFGLFLKNAKSQTADH
jgi:hypothetical protein